jgi:hypothetical protein
MSLQALSKLDLHQKVLKQLGVAAVGSRKLRRVGRLLSHLPQTRGAGLIQLPVIPALEEGVPI